MKNERFFKIEIRVKSYNSNEKEKYIEIVKSPDEHLTIEYFLHLIAEFICDIK